MLERVKLAEANGYDTAWLADERFYREVYSCLTYFAQHTSRIKVGPCVTDPYTRHPALTAMAIATLDELSGGRAILGIGAGISGFTELGVERKKPARAIREHIAASIHLVVQQARPMWQWATPLGEPPWAPWTTTRTRKCTGPWAARG